jgi:hypothetical protein
MSALEVGPGAYEAIRTAWPADPSPFSFPPPWLLSIIGTPVRIVDDLGRDGWRVLDEDGTVVTSGELRSTR